MADASQPRRYRLTPGGLLPVLLAAEIALWTSERFRWFGFNQHKGWTMLIAAAVAGAFLVLMFLWFLAALVFRWRFQFSIRSLLVLTVAVALLCGWLAAARDQARKQRQAVEAIQREDGRAIYDYELDPSGGTIDDPELPGPTWLRELVGIDLLADVISASASGDHLGPVAGLSQLRTLNVEGDLGGAGLKRLKGLAQLRELYFCGSKAGDANLVGLEELGQLGWLRLTGPNISDAGLRHVENLTGLRFLDLNGTGIGDDGLEHVKGLAKLETLCLNGTMVGDAGVGCLEGLTQLRVLSLESTEVGDAGLGHLEGLRQLESLDLGFTAVGDGGIRHLAGLSRLGEVDITGTLITDAALECVRGLSRLRQLRLRQTDVSAAGVKRLEEALPGCETWYDGASAEELVLAADFVGVVECRRAGGIVAQYRVVESWKGPPSGRRISVCAAVSYGEREFPIALCGERYFILAYKGIPENLPESLFVPVTYSDVPFWRRNIPADYLLPLFQGRRLLAAGEENTAEFDQIRRATRAILALKPDEQEAALLRAAIDTNVLCHGWGGCVGTSIEAAERKDFHKRLSNLAGAGAVVDEVLRLAEADPNKAEWVEAVLRRAGGKRAIDRLEKLPAAQSPWQKDRLDGLIAAIKRRCGGAGAKPSAGQARMAAQAWVSARAAPVARGKPPTAAELSELRKVLAAGGNDEAFGRAFQTLSQYDPQSVVQFLLAWQNPSKDWRDAADGYSWGFDFAGRCDKERRKHFGMLLGAKDPFIRVAAAVYLCFEDPAAGTRALEKFTSLEGDAGVWAALTLARRGHKDAVPRALEVFRELPQAVPSQYHSPAGLTHRDFQKRLLVLLSNAAQGGNVPQLSLPKEEAKQLEYLGGWWRQYGDKAVLEDPWLKILQQQKVD
jgi:hypothetical protein